MSRSYWPPRLRHEEFEQGYRGRRRLRIQTRRQYFESEDRGTKKRQSIRFYCYNSQWSEVPYTSSLIFEALTRRGIPGIEPGTSRTRSEHNAMIARTRSEHNATIPNPRGWLSPAGTAEMINETSTMNGLFTSFVWTHGNSHCAPSQAEAQIGGGGAEVDSQRAANMDNNKPPQETEGDEVQPYILQ